MLNNTIKDNLIDTMLLLEEGSYLSMLDDHVLRVDYDTYLYAFIESHPINCNNDFTTYSQSRTPGIRALHDPGKNIIVMIPNGNYEAEITHWLTRSPDSKFVQIPKLSDLHNVLSAKPDVIFCLQDPVNRALKSRNDQLRHITYTTGHTPKLEDFNPDLANDSNFISQFSYLPIKLSRKHWTHIRANFKTLLTDLYDVLPEDSPMCWDPHHFWSHAISPKYWLDDNLDVNDISDKVEFMWIEPNNGFATHLAKHLDIDVDLVSELTHNQIECNTEQKTRLTSLYEFEYSILRDITCHNHTT